MHAAPQPGAVPVEGPLEELMLRRIQGESVDAELLEVLANSEVLVVGMEVIQGEGDAPPRIKFPAVEMPDGVTAIPWFSSERWLPPLSADSQVTPMPTQMLLASMPPDTQIVVNPVGPLAWVLSGGSIPRVEDR